MTNCYSLFTLTRGVGIILMLLGLATTAQSFEEDSKALMTLKGKIVCMDCKLEDVAKEQPQPEGNLFYEIKHRKDDNDRERQLIINMSSTGDETRAGDTPDDTDKLRNLTGLKQSLSLRGDDKVVDELFSKENVHQEVEITGVVRSDHTFDIADVKVGSEVLSQTGEGPRPPADK